jgi:broad specificity phosphatase PhoE
MVSLTYFVHGTTTDNEAELATGWLPGKLSEKGKRQTDELAKIVAGQPFDVVICSDLARAIETAQVVFGASHQIIEDTRLREVNYGDWNGKPGQLVKENPGAFITKPFPGGESYHDVEVRLRDFCDDTRKKYADKRVAVVAHQAPQLALEVICNHKTWGQAIAQDWRLTHAYQPGWIYAL